MAQLPLALALADHASFETFVGGSNASAVEHVRSLAEAAADTAAFEEGGAGKTHLLQAACREAERPRRRAMYVALAAVSPEILSDLEHVDLLVVDDFHTVAGDLTWEQPLFVVLNAYPRAVRAERSCCDGAAAAVVSPSGPGLARRRSRDLSGRAARRRAA